jgi:hypothetical protein
MNEDEMSWFEFEGFIKERAEDDFLIDIPEYILNPAYKKEILGKDDYPTALFDDFRDLKKIDFDPKILNKEDYLKPVWADE